MPSWKSHTKQLLDLLILEQSRRAGRSTDEWVLAERMLMFNTVNAERLSAGRRPISLDSIVRVERGCTGHSDYSEKFALRCAELIFSL